MRTMWAWCSSRSTVAVPRVLESALTRLLAPHHAPASDQTRNLLREAFVTPADIRLDGGRMHVTLNQLSAPRALAYAMTSPQQPCRDDPARTRGLGSSIGRMTTHR